MEQGIMAVGLLDKFAVRPTGSDRLNSKVRLRERVWTGCSDRVFKASRLTFALSLLKQHDGNTTRRSWSE